MFGHTSALYLYFSTRLFYCNWRMLWPFHFIGDGATLESVPDLVKAMYLNIESFPCVRLLNLSGEIGCSSESPFYNLDLWCMLKIDVWNLLLSLRADVFVLLRVTGYGNAFYTIRSWKRKDHCTDCKINKRQWSIGSTIHCSSSHRSDVKFLSEVHAITILIICMFLILYELHVSKFVWSTCLWVFMCLWNMGYWSLSLFSLVENQGNQAYS